MARAKSRFSRRASRSSEASTWPPRPRTPPSAGPSARPCSSPPAAVSTRSRPQFPAIRIERRRGQRSNSTRAAQRWRRPATSRILASVHEQSNSTGSGYLVREASTRLSYAAALIALVYAIYQVLFYTIWENQGPAISRGIGFVVIALSLAVALGIKACPRPFVALVGIGYQAAVCFGLELSRYSFVKNDDLATGISWSAAVILFFPMLLPANPRATLSGALLAASMGPLGYLVAQRLGAQRLDHFAVLLSYWLPTYICALVTWVPARVIQRLGDDVRRARRLGSYELVEKLGTGGMGEVWKGRHKLLARPAAVKLIRAD